MMALGEKLDMEKCEDFTHYQHMFEFEELLQKQLAAVGRIVDD